MDNQRFKKLCRLPQLGVYVDEAHHLFGADLEKQIRSSGASKTSLRDTINLLAANTSIVACYNYTGTPYVKNQLLPEVVYAYGLRESIWNGFLKDADPIGFENVKSDEFLTAAVTTFWERYGGQTYEGLNPKLAIYAAGVEEAATEVKPALEKILSKLGVPASKILLNVGDAKYTKHEDMFTSNQGDLSVHYYDPESGRIRQYYPDFLAKMVDGSYQLIEVKGDNKIDDTVVKAKQAAAEEMAVASGVKYLMYAGSRIVSTHVLEDDGVVSQQGRLV